ncbi:hypothetical protein [Flavobacterium taihuense]|uniref:Lipoprotein n=1 Tax=Flavobacterium taihuense TaxID=2857508 RepID=A0ABS6Y0P2_9FLAO|nr:hypothetical protein [Flavobacterium taihuense]MBW4362495.1 hypothetical protein [Flavobacterium taihuense]
MKKIILLIITLSIFSCKNQESQDLTSEETIAIDSTEIIVPDKPLTEKELDSIIKEEYKSMNEDLGGFTRPPNVSKTSLEELLSKAKGSIYEKKISKSIDSLDNVMNKNILENEIAERKNYETTLRNNFLDNNLNIKVKVSGKKNTIITLSYSLFNEVWFRKFETEGHFDKLYQKGFKKIILTDNYDYTQWMKYE